MLVLGLERLGLDINYTTKIMENAARR